MTPFQRWHAAGELPIEVLATGRELSSRPSALHEYQHESCTPVRHHDSLTAVVYLRPHSRTASADRADHTDALNLRISRKYPNDWESTTAMNTDFERLTIERVAANVS